MRWGQGGCAEDGGTGGMEGVWFWSQTRRSCFAPGGGVGFGWVDCGVLTTYRYRGYPCVVSCDGLFCTVGSGRELVCLLGQRELL